MEEKKSAKAKHQQHSTQNTQEIQQWRKAKMAGEREEGWHSRTLHKKSSDTILTSVSCHRERKCSKMRKTRKDDEILHELFIAAFIMHLYPCRVAEERGAL